ncbi:hypothetical protein GIB67_001467 [Kingdonia uniflora]|uniref:EDRF1 N-terminal domain-containing protein n=1 Tax=Kingdonia uniflora TaxID=39325 RepID=A0A7J7M0K2_9MAGN|nr:hypothetical protein GIB67_038771 [Kingdonia uniflora]KAF6176410.1 hypothetical protein GIB67_001467 [Kingdonia uniflora]
MLFNSLLFSSSYASAKDLIFPQFWSNSLSGTLGLCCCSLNLLNHQCCFPNYHDHIFCRYKSSSSYGKDGEHLDKALQCSPQANCDDGDRHRSEECRLPTNTNDVCERVARGTRTTCTRRAQYSTPDKASPYKSLFVGGTTCSDDDNNDSSIEHVTLVTWLEAWFDNIMACVPELAICYHQNGVVQGYELLKTDDIFLL